MPTTADGQDARCFSFRFGWRDYVVMYLVVHRRSSARIWAERLAWTALLVFFFFLFSGWTLPILPSWDRMPPVVYEALLAALLFVVFAPHVVLYTNALAAAALMYRQLSIADAEITVDLLEDGISFRYASTKASIAWSGVTDLIERNDRLVLKVHKMEGFVIPRRAFPDEARYKAAVAFVRKQVQNAKA